MKIPDREMSDEAYDKLKEELIKLGLDKEEIGKSIRMAPEIIIDLWKAVELENLLREVMGMPEIKPRSVILGIAVTILRGFDTVMKANENKES